MLNNNLTKKMYRSLFVGGAILSLTACGLDDLGFGANYDSPFVAASSSSESSSSSSSGPTLSDVNIVINGDAEASATEATDWMLETKEYATVAVDSVEFKSGANSVKTTVTTFPAEANRWDIQIGPTLVPVEKDKTYAFSGWVIGSAGAKVMFNAVMTEDPYTTFESLELDLTGEWQEVTFDFEVTEDVTVINLPVHMGYAENIGADIYLDDFAVHEYLTSDSSSSDSSSSDSSSSDSSSSSSSASIPDLLNTNLETGETGPWLMHGGVTLAIEETEVYEGSYSLLVSGRTATWQGGGYPLLGEIEDNAEYEFTAFVKLASPEAAKITMSVKVADASGEAYPNVVSVDATDSDWVELKGTFTNDQVDNQTELYVYFESDSDVASYYVDALTVVPASESSSSSSSSSSPSVACEADFCFTEEGEDGDSGSFEIDTSSLAGTMIVANGALELTPTWVGGANEAFIVRSALPQTLDLTGGEISVDLNIPQSYFDDGKLVVQVFLNDESSRYGGLGWININTTNLSSGGDAWSTVTISDIQLDGFGYASEGFDLTLINQIGFEVIGQDGQAATGTVSVDNISVSAAAAQ